jgi:subtilisin family serine protease
MGSATYLILRVKGGKKGPPDSFSEEVWRSGESTRALAPVEYSVEARPLDPQEQREVRHDRKVAAIARPMPLQLIGPVAMAGTPIEPEPIHGATWGVFVTGALQSPFVGHGVTVAVLDTGIDAGHAAFQGVELVQEDFTCEGNGDQNGHGTHVAGTIFGRTVQGVRYSVAPGVRRALIGKVFGAYHTPTTQELVAAVQWAVYQGAHVINMSLGFDFPGQVRWWVEKGGLEADLATSRALAQYRDNVRLFDRLAELVRAQASRSSGALIVASAGNESRRQVRSEYAIDVGPPAAADGVVAVAALQSAGAPHDNLSVTPFSNIGAAVSGPGMGVYSAWTGGGFCFKNGTSMASPHVAGVAALWAERQLKRNGTVNPGALEAQLRGNARTDRIPSPSYPDVGEGLVTAPRD